MPMYAGIILNHFWIEMLNDCLIFGVTSFGPVALKVQHYTD